MNRPSARKFTSFYFPINFHFSIIYSHRLIDCRRFFIEIEFFLIMFWKLSLNFHLIKSFYLNTNICSPDFLFVWCACVYFSIWTSVYQMFYFYILEIHTKNLSNKLFYLKVQIQKKNLPDYKCLGRPCANSW